MQLETENFDVVRLSTHSRRPFDRHRRTITLKRKSHSESTTYRNIRIDSQMTSKRTVCEIHSVKPSIFSHFQRHLYQCMNPIRWIFLFSLCANNQSKQPIKNKCWCCVCAIRTNICALRYKRQRAQHTHTVHGGTLSISAAACYSADSDNPSIGYINSE